MNDSTRSPGVSDVLTVVETFLHFRLSESRRFSSDERPRGGCSSLLARIHPRCIVSGQWGSDDETLKLALYDPRHSCKLLTRSKLALLAQILLKDRRCPAPNPTYHQDLLLGLSRAHIFCLMARPCSPAASPRSRGHRGRRDAKPIDGRDITIAPSWSTALWASSASLECALFGRATRPSRSGPAINSPDKPLLLTLAHPDSSRGRCV
ncbi:hypothetical protein B0H13DRAFT_1179775 [Mycena leptocephala]|nr:hypothetical protein B0H13DRAFT_1179775 [Mycena leptocephala]